MSQGYLCQIKIKLMIIIIIIIIIIIVILFSYTEYKLTQPKNLTNLQCEFGY